MRVTNPLTFALASLQLVAVACQKGDKDGPSETKYLDVGKAVGDAAGDGPQVVFYYANETVTKGAYAESYAKIVNALKSSRDVVMTGTKLDDDPAKDLQKKEELSKNLEIYGQRIEDDKGCFASVVDEEIGALTKSICNDPKNKNVHLVVFSSGLMQEGRFIYCLPGQGARTEDFTALASIAKIKERSPVINSNPATYAGTLLAAFRQMRSALNLPKGTRAQVSLIVKSHGYSVAGRKDKKGRTFNDLDHSVVAVPRLPFLWQRLGGKNASDETRKRILVKIFKRSIDEMGRVPRPSCPGKGASLALLGQEGLGSEALGTEALGTEALGSEALGSEALGSEALGSEALGSEALGSEALGIEALGSEALGSEALGAESGELDALDSQVSAEKVVASIRKSGGWLTKRVFLEILGSVGHNFPVALTESCSSYWGDAVDAYKKETQISKLPIGHLVGSGKKDARVKGDSKDVVAYKNVDYPDFLPNAVSAQDKAFADAFTEYLKKIDGNGPQR